MRVAATATGWVVVLAGVTVFAQQAPLRRDGVSGQPNQMNFQVQADDTPLPEKRDWLREQMLREFSDVDRRAEIAARVAQMPPERVDALVKIYQKRAGLADQEQTNEARRDQALSQAYRDAQVQQYQNRLAAARAGGRSVGYAPVITWLPEGTSLGVSAVVSPDRRYVRMSLQPFFSYIPRVDTFNFYTGETRTYYPQHGFQPNGFRRNGVSNPDRPRPPRTYYDGVRTRTVHP